MFTPRHTFGAEPPPRTAPLRYTPPRCLALSLRTRGGAVGSHSCRKSQGPEPGERRPFFVRHKHLCDVLVSLLEVSEVHRHQGEAGKR